MAFPPQDSINPITGLTEKPERPLGEINSIDGGKVARETPSAEQFGFYGGRGIGEGKFTEGVLPAEIPYLDQIRAMNQTSGGQAFNAVVGGIASGVLTAAESMSYLLDFENNLNMLAGMENAESNWFAELMQKGKEGLEGAMPIYQRDPDKVFDWGDSGFYWSSLKGIIDSAVGFAVPGMAAAKGVGAVQAGIRSAKFLDFLHTSTKVQQMANSGFAGMISNFAEGKMMGLELYESSMAQMEQSLFEENYNRIKEFDTDNVLSRRQIEQEAGLQTQQQLKAGKAEEFEGIAGERADQFINRNRIFALTDAVGLHGIYKGKGAIRNTLQKRGVGTFAKRFVTPSSDNLLIQAGKEGLEEIGQNVLQMEGEYQASKGAGYDSEESSEHFAIRAYDFATSDKALLEGMMGLFGGGPQRVFTEAISGNYSKGSRESHNKRYEEQQAQIETNKEFLNKKLGWYAQAHLHRAEAIRRGETSIEQLMKDVEFLAVAADNMERGTLDSLEKQIQDIAKMTPQQAKEAGFDDNYREQAKAQLTKLKSMEKDWSNFTRYENQRDVFDNRQERQIMQEEKERLEDIIDETESDLRQQGEQPDPKSQDDLKRYKTMLEQVEKEITSQDEEFTSLTSADQQAFYRKQRKDNERRVKDRIKQDKSDEKQASEKESSEGRKKKANRKKSEEKTEQTEEEVDKEQPSDRQKKDDINASQAQEQKDPDVMPDEESTSKAKDDIDVNTVTPPDEDTTPSVSALAGQTADGRDASADELKAEANDAANSREVNDALDQLFDDAEQGGLREIVEGEPQEDPIAKRVRLFRQLYEAVKKQKGEDPTFDDLIDVSVAKFGPERVEPLFGMFEGLYKQINQNYAFTNDFKAFRKMTPDERRELEGGRRVAEKDINQQYNTKTDKQVEDAAQGIEDDMHKLDRPVDPTENNVYIDYKRIESGSGVLAYLSRKFEQIFRKGNRMSRIDTEDTLNEDLQDKDILDPNKYPPGTKVTLMVKNDRKTPAYVEGDYGKKKTNWGAKQDIWEAEVKAKRMTQAQMDQKVLEQTPISVIVDGKEIGFLHETEWINESNVLPQNLQQDRERSIAIRKHILDNKGYETTIKSRSTGYLAKSTDGYMDLLTAMEDETLPIVVVKNGDFHTSKQGKMDTKGLINSGAMGEGVSHVVVPIGKDKRLAIPLKRKRLGESEEVIDSIMTAIDIFYNERTDDEANRIVEAIKDKKDGMGINIRNPKGFTAYVETFINNYNIGKSGTLERHLKSEDFIDHLDDAFMNMNIRGTNDVNFTIGRGRAMNHAFISKGGFENLEPHLQKKNIDAIRENLGLVYGHVNLTNLGRDGNVVLVRGNGVMRTISYKKHVQEMSKTQYLGFNLAKEGEEPRYVYTIQPIIELNFSEIDNERVGVNEEEQNPAVTPAAVEDEFGTGAEEETDLGTGVTPEVEKKKPTGPPPPDYKGGMRPNPDQMKFRESVSLEGMIEQIEEATEVEVIEVETKKGKKRKTVRGVVISAMNSIRQEQIVNFLRGEVENALFSDEEVVANTIYKKYHKQFSDNLEIANQRKAWAVENGDIAMEEESDSMITELNLILDNYDKLVMLAEVQIKKIDSVETRNYNPEDNSTNIEEKESSAMNDGWGGNYVFTMNPSDSLAPKLKQFLSGIGQWRVNEGGEIVPALNYMNLQKPLSYQQAYEILQRLTPNLPPNFDKMIKKLEEIAKDENKVKTYPFMPALVEKLKGADKQVQVQFVSGLTNHDVNMRFIMFARDKSGKTKLIERQSNANEIAEVLRSNWHRTLIADTAAQNPKDPAEYIIPVETRDKLIEQLDTWKKMVKEGNTPMEAPVRAWLEELGIVVTDQTWKDFVDGKIKHNGYVRTYKEQIGGANGIVYQLGKNVATRGDASLISGERLIDQGVVKSLSKHDADYAKEAYSNSHRTANKTVYSFGQNKFLVNRLRELNTFVNGTNVLLEDLNAISFNSRSAWLQELRDNGAEGDFSQNFDRWVFSLEPLKEIGKQSYDNREMGNLSHDAIEVTKLGMLQAAMSDLSGHGNRIIQLLYPTASDKSTVMGLRVIAQALSLDATGDIADESIERIIDLVVQPEIERIKSFQIKKESDRKANIKGYNQGAEQFLLLPLINTIPGLFTEKGVLTDFVDSTTAMDLIRTKIKEYMKSEVDRKVAFWTENGIGVGEQPSFLDNAFVSGTTAPDNNPMSDVDPANIVRGAATDMVFQYLIGNAEMAKLFTGDPALYYKTAKVNMKGSVRKAKFNEDGTSDYDFVADAEETYLNIGKRLAADIAPGYELAEGDKMIYRQAFVADAPGVSEVAMDLVKLLDGDAAYNKVKNLKGKELKDAVDGLIAEPYFGFDAADAQEYTTWEEHLYVMMQAGEISEEDKAKAEATIKAGRRLEKGLMKKIMQPMKPVYVDNKIDREADVERRIYIKSSAFPLLPELTKGRGLDNLRVAMEKQGIDRVAHSTAVKVGDFTNPVVIHDETGKMLSADQIQLEESSIDLNRKGFRLQQKIPYDPFKATINKVTQASKNLFINMLNVEGFQVPWNSPFFDSGEEVSGVTLQKEYYRLYGELHRIEYEKLLSQLTDTGHPDTLNRDKLRKILLQEAMERNYPISDQEMLHLDKELNFIPFSPSANKYEALLNSIVLNRVVKLKMPGKSMVLGAEAGFEEKALTDTEADEKIKQEIQKGGIVATKRWTGKLLPAREDPKTGKRLPAQAIVPWKFKDKKGKTIDMSKYLVKQADGTYVINDKQIAAKALEIFGMRIPNQGPNSQSWIEIVGFLPEASGDLFIATKDYVVQMGSDFDVDKIYTYMYDTYESDDDKILIHRSEETDQDKTRAYQNKILDIHIAIHKNPDKTVQKQIANPLGFWKLKDKKEPHGGLANEVETLRRERRIGGNKEDNYFTGLSDEYQRTKFTNAAAGKAGVGVFSLDSMLNAVAQGKELKYVIDREEDGTPIYLDVTFGNKKSDGDLSRELALDNLTYISDIIAGYQSAAVDNENEQILDKLNINNRTFKVIKLLNQLGFGEEVPLFLSQDIIFAYVEELNRLYSPLSGYVANKEDEARQIVLKKFDIDSSTRPNMTLADHQATPDKMREYIAKGEEAEFYKEAQYAFLTKFMELSNLGQSIQDLQSTINPDSKGFGKSIMESQLKEKQVYGLAHSRIENADSLIGEIIPIKPEEIDNYEALGYMIREGKGPKGTSYAVKSNTINGHAIVYGLFLNNDLWGGEEGIFDYDTPVIQTLMKQAEAHTLGSSDLQTSAKADRRLELWKDIKSYIFSDDSLGLHDTTVELERMRLLYDKFENKERVKDSLAHVVDKIKQTEFGKNDPFLSRLEPFVQKNGNPSIITYRASRAEDADETPIYSAFVDLITERVDGSSPAIEGITFNGEPYTKQKLGQDLILYAYITGGVQEAIQFVKYIPAAYLTTLPFAEELSNMAYVERDFGITKMDDKFLQYYNIAPFVEQYIQHNPNKVPSVTLKEVNAVWKGGKKKTIVGKFKLKEDTSKRLISEESGYPPPFVSVRLGSSESGYMLYKYDPKNGTYVQIDTLGTFGASEYNKNAIGRHGSMIKRNKSVVPPADQPTGPNVTDRQPIVSKKAPPASTEKKLTDTTLDKVTKGTHANLTYKDGIEKTKSILNNMTQNSDNAYHAYLADELYQHIGMLPSNMQIQIKKKGRGEAGEYDILKHKLSIVSDQHNAIEVTQRTFLHELLHGMTAYKIAYHVFPPESNMGGKVRAGVKNIPDWQPPSAKEIAAIDSLRVLMKQAKKAILATDVAKEEFADFERRLPLGDVTPDELDRFYGLTNLFEFITVAFTRPEFQAVLNGIELTDKKTFWQALVERVMRLIEAMGFDAKKGTVLYETMAETFDLIGAREIDKAIVEQQGETPEAEAPVPEPEVEEIVKVYEENRTYYKFVFEEGKTQPNKGYYSQGNPNNWKPLNIKTMFDTHDRVKAYNELNSETVQDDNQMELPDGKIITFSEEQYDGLKNIREWLKGNKRFFTLSGYAGTGKTTIIKKIIDEQRQAVVVSAPTHKAKNKISETTGRQAMTLHALLGMRPDANLANYDARDQDFKVDPEKVKITGIPLLIIDEASMINEGLFELIKEMATGKVIFMGDEAQIPPVGEVESQVFTEFKNTPEFHQLIHTQRQSDGNPLGLIYDAIRDNLRTADGGFKRQNLINAKGDGISFVGTSEEFKAALKNTFTRSEAKSDPEFAKIITWDNDSVARSNRTVRKIMYGEDVETLVDGEILMGYRTVNRRGQNVVENAADYQIIGKSELTTNEYGSAGWDVTIEYVDGGSKKQLRTFIIDPSDTEGYVKAHQEIRARAKASNRWGEFQDFRALNMLIADVKVPGHPVARKDFDYGYAITAHKSQGSTYQHVFVIESNMDRNRKTKERNQIKYVALSRPVHSATVLTDRDIESGNAYVDKPTPENDVVDPVNPDTTPTQGEIDNPSKGNVPPGGNLGDGNINDDVDVASGEIDDDVSGEVDDMFSIEPQEFVSDRELDEFIRKCKG